MYRKLISDLTPPKYNSHLFLLSAPYYLGMVLDLETDKYGQCLFSICQIRIVGVVHHSLFVRTGNALPAPPSILVTLYGKFQHLHCKCFHLCFHFGKNLFVFLIHRFQIFCKIQFAHEAHLYKTSPQHVRKCCSS